jgi:ubiquinone biosynthesis protein UbiJ
MALHDDVMNIAKNYMGLAAEEYISRRCRISFKIEVQDLEKEHLDRLAEAIATTAEVYVGKEKVKQFRQEILDLKKRY